MPEHPSHTCDSKALPTATLGAGDAGELLTLQRAAYVTEAAAHQDFDLPPLTESHEDLKAVLSDPAVTAFGIRAAGRLIAAVRVEKADDAVLLGRLIVAPDLQGQGFGTRLLLHAEGVHPGTREMRLFTGEHSIANLRLYQRHGYCETHRTSVGSYELVHLVKVL